MKCKKECIICGCVCDCLWCDVKEVGYNVFSDVAAAAGDAGGLLGAGGRVERGRRGPG